MRGVLLFLTAGLFAAEPIPPLAVVKAFAASPQAAWQAVVQAVGEEGGVIRFSDADSGLLLYSRRAAGEKSTTYINVYLEPLAGQVRVYFIAHIWDGRSLEPVEARFFAALRRSLKEVSGYAAGR
jgi:hypothetical protein